MLSLLSIFLHISLTFGSKQSYLLDEHSIYKTAIICQKDTRPRPKLKAALKAKDYFGSYQVAYKSDNHLNAEAFIHYFKNKKSCLKYFSKIERENLKKPKLENEKKSL